MYPFFSYLNPFFYFKDNCFIHVVKIKSKNKSSKITDLYSM